MGRVRSVCARADGHARGRTGSLAGVASAGAEHVGGELLVAMAEDMVEEGVVELINLCVRRDDRRGALPGALYRRLQSAVISTQRSGLLVRSKSAPT